MKQQYTAPTLQVVECQIREQISSYEDISGWSQLKPLPSDH